MLTGAGLDQVWHHSRAHRLFTDARWSGDALGSALADLIVARLLPAGAALTIAVDDTLFKRSGKGVGEARNRTRRAAERTVPFGLICFSVVTVWYALHGHAPEEVATHRARARWYTTKT